MITNHDAQSGGMYMIKTLVAGAVATCALAACGSTSTTDSASGRASVSAEDIQAQLNAAANSINAYKSRNGGQLPSAAEIGTVLEGSTLTGYLCLNAAFGSDGMTTSPGNFVLYTRDAHDFGAAGPSYFNYDSARVASGIGSSSLAFTGCPGGAQPVTLPATVTPSRASSTPRSTVGWSMNEVGTQFIDALKRGDIATAQTYVQAATPAIAAAAVAPGTKDPAAFQRVAGARCSGRVCFAAGYPATPEPGWLLQEANDGWHVAAGVDCASPNGSCRINGSRPPQEISKVEAGF